MRTLRTVVAAGSLLAVAACTSPGMPDPPGPTTVLASVAPPTSTSGPARTGPPQPSPPALAAVPVRAVPACARVACQATALVPNVRPGIHLALVRGPDPDPARQTAYLLSLDSAARPLHSQQLRNGDAFFDQGLRAPACDQLWHCFVPAGVGAHGGVLNVVAVGPAGELSDLSQGGELAADTPDVRPRDLDGDGIAEVLGVLNDYQPDYASGTRYWMVWGWHAGRYLPLGCQQVRGSEPEPAGLLALSGCPS